MLTNPQELNELQLLCHVCAGSGHIAMYNHVAGGECFTCNGTGHIDQTEETYDRVVIKQYTRKLVSGGSLEFMFWNDGSIQIVDRDQYDEWCGTASVTQDEAREIWTTPAVYFEQF